MLQAATRAGILKGLECTEEGILKVAVEGVVNNSNGLPTTRMPQLLNVSNPGTIAAGNNSVSIENFGNNDGLVLGVVLPSGASVSWSVSGGDQLGAIEYDASETQFLISILI